MPHWPAGVPRAVSCFARKFARKADSTIRKLKFEPRMRLHHAAEFQDIKRRGKKFGDAFFSIAVLANAESHPRLGLSIATRIFGTAVSRNRIKRLTRESFRLNQHELPAVDVTVSARDAAAKAQLADLRDSLDKHWKAIRTRC